MLPRSRRTTHGGAGCVGEQPASLTTGKPWQPGNSLDRYMGIDTWRLRACPVYRFHEYAPSSAQGRRFREGVCLIISAALRRWQIPRFLWGPATASGGARQRHTRRHTARVPLTALPHRAMDHFPESAAVPAARGKAATLAAVVMRDTGTCPPERQRAGRKWRSPSGDSIADIRPVGRHA